MLASAAQFCATTDKKANFAEAEKRIIEAAEAGARLVVLPENSMYSNPDPAADVRPDAEPIDGPYAQLLQRTAADRKITVVAGMTETPGPDDDRAINAVLAFGEDGASLGVYRKVHLYDAFGYRESDRIAPQPPDALIFALDGVTFGVMTCYDLRFPEMARFLVDAGAEVVIVPAAWVAGPLKEDHWTTLARARAIENTAYVMASGMTGPVCTGQSAIIDPMGVVIACAGEEPGAAYATIEAERVATVRRKNPSLANRRFTVAFTG